MSPRFSGLARTAAVAVALAWLCATLPDAARAQDLGTLTPHLEIGTFAPWTGTAEGDAYVLSNAAEAGAIKYYWTSGEGQEGTRSLAVDVELREAAEGSGAGLLYGYQQEPLGYFLLILQSGNRVVLYQRSAEGFEQRMSIGGDRVRPGANRLEIRERGNEIDMLVNGQSIGALGNDLLGRGGLGIAAVGTGTFVFSEYAQTGQ